MEGMNRYEQLNNAIFTICKHRLVNDKQLCPPQPLLKPNSELQLEVLKVRNTKPEMIKM